MGITICNDNEKFSYGGGKKLTRWKKKGKIYIMNGKKSIEIQHDDKIRKSD